MVHFYLQAFAQAVLRCLSHYTDTFAETSPSQEDYFVHSIQYPTPLRIADPPSSALPSISYLLLHLGRQYTCSLHLFVYQLLSQKNMSPRAGIIVFIS